MATNAIYEMGQKILKQADLLQKCNAEELDEECKRAEFLSKMSGNLAELAKVEVSALIEARLISSNNLLFANEEKIVTSALIAEAKPIKAKGLLMDEFTRGKAD